MPANRILDTTYGLFFQDRVQDVTLEGISKASGIPVEEIIAIYPTLDDITKILAKRSITKLKKDGLELAKVKGIEALRQLVSNDIKFFYRVEIDRKLLTPQTMVGHESALKLFDDYFNIEMPEIYGKFLKNNPELLPSEDINIEFYAHFISHSLKFFNFATLETYESTSEGRKAVTELIIGSLFGLDFLELPKF